MSMLDDICRKCGGNFLLPYRSCECGANDPEIFYEEKDTEMTTHGIGLPNGPTGNPLRRVALAGFVFLLVLLLCWIAA